jgi:hypothetical protein
MRTGVMWSDDLVRVMIRAAEFWMICSLLISLVGVRWGGRCSSLCVIWQMSELGFQRWIGSVVGGVWRCCGGGRMQSGWCCEYYSLVCTVCQVAMLCFCFVFMFGPNLVLCNTAVLCVFNCPLGTNIYFLNWIELKLSTLYFTTAQFKMY